MGVKRKSLKEWLRDLTVHLVLAEDAIEELQDREVDYIVEQGTSGVWTYRKWNSGIAELWGTTNTANYNMTTSYGGTYYGTITISIMSGIFESIDSLTVNRANGGQGTVWVSPYCSYTNVKNGSISMYISNGTSYSNAPLSFSVNVKGKWK